MNIWSVILSPDFLFTSIRVMTPILFAAMACMVFVKGGIDPIGTEGIMLSCALAGETVLRHIPEREPFRYVSRTDLQHNIHTIRHQL